MTVVVCVSICRFVSMCRLICKVFDRNIICLLLYCLVQVSAYSPSNQITIIELRSEENSREYGL